MGRKNRNRISTCKTEQDEEQDEYKEDVDETSRLEKINECEHQFNSIWETRKAMIEYCDNTGIPLCDYLTIDIFEDFLNYLADSQ